MPNILDTDNLGLIFNTADNSSMSLVPQNESILANVVDSSDDNDFDDQLKDLLENSNTILVAAKYLITTTPDAESVAAAASLIGSVTGIVSEFRKSSQMKKRFEYQKQLEQLKIDAKERLQLKKIEAQKENVKIGDGNTINIQNNNLIPFSQERIINIIEEKKKALQIS